jgi:hypothetical protein
MRVLPSGRVDHHRDAFRFPMTYLSPAYRTFMAEIVRNRCT